MTRHVRSWALAALAAFALAGAATPSLAGITYNVTNYIAGQNGWSLAGTITTSRTGTITSASDITAWDLTASKDLVNHQYDNTTTTAPFPLTFNGTLNATSTTLSLGANSRVEFTQNSDGLQYMGWYNQYQFTPDVVNSTYFAVWAVGQDQETLWSTSSFSPIIGGAWTLGTATPSGVPEIDPATGGSALSLVAGVLAMIEQRRRRATLVA